MKSCTEGGPYAIIAGRALRYNRWAGPSKIAGRALRYNRVVGVFALLHWRKEGRVLEDPRRELAPLLELDCVRLEEPVASSTPLPDMDAVITKSSDLPPASTDACV